MPNRGAPALDRGLDTAFPDVGVATERERELAAIIGAYNDVTERLKGAHDRLTCEVGRLRDELRAKNEELRRRERLAALGEMAAGLAHEVRNPLGGIALYASKLERELTEQPSARRAAHKIVHGVKSLDRLISEILDFAQEDRLDLADCRLGDVLAAALESVDAWAAEGTGTIVVETAAHDLRLTCDPARLRQVVINLLMNGLQAVSAGGEVRISAAVSNDAMTEIAVSDNGPGIAPDCLDRIFNPFYTTKATGTGLGLAIVHRIVEAHGGTITAGNGPQGGACFVVRIPAPTTDSRSGRH